MKIPDHYQEKQVKCSACRQEFTASQSTPQKPNPAFGCLFVIIVFIVLFIIISSNSSSNSTRSESDREFRIKRETERIQYERAKSVRDALEHIEAKERAKRY